MSEPFHPPEPGELPELTESMHLVLRHQQGDPLAIEQLLQRYQGRLRRIVRIRLGSRLRAFMDSMDIVQEASLVAARKLSDFDLRDHASILQWLSQIVLNQIRDARDYIEADKRRPEGELLRIDPFAASQTRAGLQIATGDSLPEERAMRSELREIMDECIGRLPHDYREVILLRDYQGGSWDFVAAELNRSTVHAAQELHGRAWKKLKRMVRPRLGGLE